MPTGPRSTALAKPSATPSMIAVPQSAPHEQQPALERAALQSGLLLEAEPVGEAEHVQPASTAAAAS
jgi:hypothetical protein